MKKLSALLLTTAMLLSFAACGQGGKKLEKSLNALSTDTFAVEMDMMGVEMAMYRKSNDICMYMNYMGMAARVIVKGMKMYVFNESEKTYFITDIDDVQLDELMKSFDGLDTIAGSLAGEDVTFVEKGKAEFMGKNRSYEEYSSEAQDQNMRAFFDGSDLVGFKTDSIEIEFYVSAKPGNDKFSVPDGYKEVEYDGADLDIDEILSSFNMFG